MKLNLDTKTIQYINLFQNLTGASVMDCVDEEGDLFFVVQKGQYGLAVGKGGIKIKNAERVFKKNIKVIEHSDELRIFIKNMMPEVMEIDASDDKNVFVRIKPSDRSHVIGKGGKNIRAMNKLVKRFFGVDSLKVK